MGNESLPVFVFGCMACGKTVAGNESSCPRCGASFDEVKFECPFCGELISPSQRRCPSCGTEFGAFAENVSEIASVDLDGAMIEDSTGATPSSGTSEDAGYECPNCGKPVAEADQICPHCGARFG